MWTEGLSSWSDHELHRLGMHLRAVLAGRESTDNLARDIARGQEAYRILYERYAVRLFYYVRDEVLFADEYQEFAEDAAQAVFLQLWLRDEPTEPGVELWGLLRCCAHDRARDIVRSYAKLRSRRRKPGPQPTPVGAADEAADEHSRRQFNNVAPGQLERTPAREGDPARPMLDQEINDADLARVLRELSEEDRRIVEDHYIREVPVEKLAEQHRGAGTSREKARRRIYQLLHRFRTTVRREHPLTAQRADAAIDRLENALQMRGIAAGDLLTALRAEKEIRAGQGNLLAELFLIVTRLRRRVADRSAREVRQRLEDALFRLRLRADSPALPALVRQQIDRVLALRGSTEVDPEHRALGRMTGLGNRDLVAVGRRLRRIAGWLEQENPRGAAALSDLVLELQLRGGDGAAGARQAVTERLLRWVSPAGAASRARELLERLEGEERWRQGLRLVVRLERGKRPPGDGQVLEWIERLPGDGKH